MNFTNIKKIKNSKNTRLFWIINGFFKVLDGLIQIISLGYYSGQFALNHLCSNVVRPSINYKN